MSELLHEVKRQKWFYEFLLPDGTRTESYLDAHFRQIHVTRERALRQFLSETGHRGTNALDVACHEGYFSLVLSEYFDSVVGIDKNSDSLGKASQIARLLAIRPIDFRLQSLEELGAEDSFEFVLCFGLLYHVENPLQILRGLGRLARRSLCIETQLLPIDLETSVEDGSYLSLRPARGLFALCADYSTSKEGGLTDLALVPSRRALEFCLHAMGFPKIRYFGPSTHDYEQFVRGHRVVILAERDSNNTAEEGRSQSTQAPSRLAPACPSA